jgi:hypothetical protein
MDPYKEIGNGLFTPAEEFFRMVHGSDLANRGMLETPAERYLRMVHGTDVRGTPETPAERYHRMVHGTNVAKALETPAERYYRMVNGEEALDTKLKKLQSELRQFSDEDLDMLYSYASGESLSVAPSSSHKTESAKKTTLQSPDNLSDDDGFDADEMFRALLSSTELTVSDEANKTAKPIAKSHNTITGKMRWYPDTFDFEFIPNNGGPRGIDCAILSLRHALERETGCSSDLVTHFQQDPLIIREKLVDMFLNTTDQEVQLLSAASYVDIGESAQMDDNIRQKVVTALRKEFLSWQTIDQYLRFAFPNQVNAVLWEETDTNFDCIVMDQMDTTLPSIHIVRWTRGHFEALVPVDPDAVMIGLMCMS